MIVNDTSAIPKAAILVTRIVDGRWRVYMPGDGDIPEFMKPTAQQKADLVAAIEAEQANVIAAKSHAKLQALIGMTPAQVQSWVSASVTTLAQAQDAISTLAVAVSVLARKL